MNLFQRIVKGIQSIFSKSKEPEIDHLNSQKEPEYDPLEGFKRENQHIIDEANRRIRNLEDNDLNDFSRAYTNAMSSGGAFDINDLDSRQAVIREVLRAENFLNDPSSTVAWASLEKRGEIGKQTIEDLKLAQGVDLFKTRNEDGWITNQLVGEFWSAVDRVREEDDLGGRLAAINYSKDQAYGYALNMWMKSNKDPRAIKEALEAFLRQYDKAHTEQFSAIKGKAVFNSEGDW